MTESLDNDTRLAFLHQALVHERHGIVTSLHEQNELRDVPGLFVFGTRTGNPAFFRRNVLPRGPAASAGSGVGFNRQQALWATLGETMERYCASIYDPDQLLVASAEELGDQAVDLDSFILFSEAQYAKPGFNFHPPDRSVPRQWSKATNLQTQGMNWIPSQLIYLGPDLLDRREELMQNTSTGLACGENLQQARLSGLCEVIERDAFAAMWQLAMAPTPLSIDADTEKNLSERTVESLYRGPLKIHLWSLETDIEVPVILAMAESVEERIFSIGASCHLQKESAIEKAVAEALHGFAWGRLKLLAKDPLPALEDVLSPSDHHAFYLNPENRHLADFLFEKKAPIPASALPQRHDDLADLVAHLASMGYDAFAVDVTTQDIAELGFHVSRAIVPGLQPLLFGTHLHSEDRRRLDRLGRHWSYAGEHPASIAPHPFP